MVADRETIAGLVAGWQQAGVPPRDWAVQARGERVHVVPELLRRVDPAAARVFVSYAHAATVSSPSYRFPPSRVRVTDDLEVTVERRQQVANRAIEPGDVAGFAAMACDGLPVPQRLGDLASLERLPEGLPDYY